MDLNILLTGINLLLTIFITIVISYVFIIIKALLSNNQEKIRNIIKYA